MLQKTILKTIIITLVTLLFTACAVKNSENKKPNVTLTNTYFKAIVLNNKKVEVFQKEPFLKLEAKSKTDAQVVGALGCNNFFGTAKIKEEKISFNNLGSTKMMCPNIKTEDRFSKVLQNTRSYKIKGETLRFFDENKNEIAKFKAVYF